MKNEEQPLCTACSQPDCLRYGVRGMCCFWDWDNKVWRGNKPTVNSNPAPVSACGGREQEMHGKGEL